MRQREGKFKCPYSGCKVNGLSSKRNLLRHQESVHSSAVVLACGSIRKYRRDNIIRHRRKCEKCQESDAPRERLSKQVGSG